MADTTDLKRRLRRSGAGVHDKAVVAMGRKLDEVVPIGAPREGGGPKLKDDQSIRLIRTPPSFLGTIEYTVPQAEFTNDGTSPHMINGAPTLAFFWPKVGRTVFFRSVQHPGNEAQRWFSKVMTQAEWQESLALAAARTNLPS